MQSGFCYVGVYPCSTEAITSKPCNQHATITRERYTPRVETVGCIDRALIAPSKEPYCLPQEHSSSGRKRRAEKAGAAVNSIHAAVTTGADSCGKLKNRGGISKVSFEATN
ncbi:hypothetical protein F5Y10DRAFT_246320 [Nemania abortiva]|nr:hypothetical protein F5Y10DRAFT_246320 [Nemania abortiva]